MKTMDGLWRRESLTRAGATQVVFYNFTHARAYISCTCQLLCMCTHVQTNVKL